jgi:choline-sulfatase
MPRPKNVIILCSDELRGDCVGYAGNRDVRTPNIDALAGEGVAFMNHFATFPKCTPSRVSLMTGRYCHTGGYRTLGQRLDPEQPDLLCTLAAEGYQTAVFGKNHCWDDARWESIKHRSDAPAYADLLPPKRPLPATDKLPRGWDYAGNVDVLGEKDAAHVEQTLRFLRENRDREQPFFLQLNIEAPHPVYGVAEPYFSGVDRDSIEPFPTALPENPCKVLLAQRAGRTGTDIDPAHALEVQATYYGMIHQVDDHVGRVMTTLRELDLLDDSIIVFWSDHGDYAGQYGLAEKWDTHFPDCLVHVPCILRAPGWPRGRQVEHLSDHTDVCPTLAALLGLDLPWTPHGHDLAPTIEGQSIRDAVFSEGGHEPAVLARAPDAIARWMLPAEAEGHQFPKTRTYHDYPHSMVRSRMVRTPDHKLITRLNGDDEYYDLHNDPWELRNLIHDPSTTAAQLTLHRHLAKFALLTAPDHPPIDGPSA